MNDLDSQNLEDGIVLSRRLSKQQLWSSVAMLASTALAYTATRTIAHGDGSLAVAIAAAVGLSVGVYCSPEVYRDRNGSTTPVCGLVAVMWGIPTMIMTLRFFQ